MTRDKQLFPDDEIGDALWALQEDGEDLSFEREVEFAVIFPDEQGAECARRWFRSRWDLGEIACVPVSGGGVEVQEEPDPA